MGVPSWQNVYQNDNQNAEDRMDRVRLGVIGIGNIGNLHLGNIEQQPKVELTACATLCRRRQRRQARSMG